jgi:hypothetical protein
MPGRINTVTGSAEYRMCRKWYTSSFKPGRVPDPVRMPDDAGFEPVYAGSDKCPIQYDAGFILENKIPPKLSAIPKQHTCTFNTD